MSLIANVWIVTIVGPRPIFYLQNIIAVQHGLQSGAQS